MTAPAMGSSSATSVALRTRLWQVRLPLQQAADWVKHQHVTGLKLGDASASASGPQGPLQIGYQFDGGTPSPAWRSATLEVSVGPGRDGRVVMRADGVVEWLDPTPTRDDQQGPRLRLTADGTCPISDRGIVGVSATGAPGDRLLPAGRPTAALVCRWSGLNGTPPMHLVAQQRLDAAAAEKLAERVATVNLGHAVDAVMHCPMADQTVVALALAYPGRPDTDLWISASGCSTIANGAVSALWPPQDLITLAAATPATS